MNHLSSLIDIIIIYDGYIFVNEESKQQLFLILNQKKIYSEYTCCALCISIFTRSSY